MPKTVRYEMYVNTMEMSGNLISISKKSFEYLMFFLKGELRNHGIYMREYTDEKDCGISG